MAMANAGCIYENGSKGVRRNKTRALELFLAAADQGLVEGKFRAGLLLRVRGHPGDLKKARQLILESADEGYIEAMSYAGEQLEKEFEGEPADLDRALDYHLIAADNGDSGAMFSAGMLLKNQYREHEQLFDVVLALKLFLQAIENGQHFARCHAADILSQVEQLIDKKKALALYLQSAKSGCSHAMFNAGTFLAEGFEGQPADQDRALRLFLRSANEGESRAMVSLAQMYLDAHQDDPQNLKSALFWLEKAKLLGEPLAEKYLQTAYQLDAESKEKDDLSLENLLKETTTLISGGESHAQSSSTVKTPEMSNEDDFEDQIDTVATPSNHQTSPEKIRNIKEVRKRFREIAQLEKATTLSRTKQPILTLSEDEQKIANAILFTGNTQAIDHNALKRLFDSPFFQGQVEVTRTTQGLAVNAFNRETRKFASASTHRKHKQSYKGAQPEFVRNLRPILELFNVRQTM
jgi:TPR repeat protein